MVMAVKYPSKHVMTATSTTSMAVIAPAKWKLAGSVTKELEEETISAKKSAVMVKTWATNNAMTRTITSVMAVTISASSKMEWPAQAETKLGTTLALKTVETEEISESFLAMTEIQEMETGVMTLARSKEALNACSVQVQLEEALS